VTGLREAGYRGAIMLVGEEGLPPYERPPLSKGFLLGREDEARLWLRPREQYGELGVELLLANSVAEVDLTRHRVLLGTGGAVAYDRLLLATGAEARRLPGLEDGIHLRRLPDARSLKAALQAGPSLQIVGAGFIGCEVAAVAAALGAGATVFETLQQPMERVLGSRLGAYVAGVHRRHGVELRLGTGAPPSLRSPYLVAAGSTPRDELARRAGLRNDGGILVDEFGATDDPAVFAAGDVARFWSRSLGARIRVEHFQTAWRHGRSAGANIAGAGQPFDEIPWFWSEQYDLTIHYAGGGLPWDEMVIRGELGVPPFSAFFLAGGALRAVAGFNDSRTVSRARRLLELRVPVTRRQLEDPSVDLKRLSG
jgi:3-phenylpropionate/trans-cinnamate dioxygenase ferredoxin reductase subunit